MGFSGQRSHMGVVTSQIASSFNYSILTSQIGYNFEELSIDFSGQRTHLGVVTSQIASS